MIKSSDPFQDWVSLLQDVSDAQKFPRTYLVSTHEGRNYQAMTQAEIDGALGIRKLKLKEIVKLSQEAFDKAQKQYLTRDPNLNARKFLLLTNQLDAHLEKLILNREAKRNQPLKRLGRGIGYTFTGGASWLTSYGSQYYAKMQQSHKEFVEENQQLRDSIHTLKQTKPIHNLNSRLARVAGLVSTTLKESDASDLKKFIHLHLSQNKIETRDSSSIACTPIFALDMARGVRFIRKDPLYDLKDLVPVPQKELEPSQLISSGAAAIEELTKRKNDKKWIAVLQNAATQTTLTALFNNVKAAFIHTITSDTWQENGKDMSLSFDFAEELPPIKIEIVRDPNSRDIQKLLVKVEGYGDILRVIHDEREEKELIAARAISGTLSYSVSLTDDDQPLIEDFAIDLKSHL